jgi:ABC-type multidrug transport system fused ATPase/permease subunit
LKNDKKLNFKIENSGKNLSNTQKKLLGLARVILENRKILILDDLTSGVDKETEILIEQILFDSFKSKTILMVSNKLRTISKFDKVLILKKGLKYFFLIFF